MLKCKMCLGRKLKAKLAVLRSADRSIQYQTSDPIKIDENNVISLKLDSAVLRINNQGELTLDIPSQGDINSILNHLSNYLPSHSLINSNIPLVTNGAGKAKWATDTIGSDVKPIFLNSGKITASNGNKGSSAKPIYMQGGELKESSSNLGGEKTPIYMQNGELKPGIALNNAAYRDVAASIDSSNKLVPSSLIKNRFETVENKLVRQQDLDFYLTNTTSGSTLSLRAIGKAYFYGQNVNSSPFLIKLSFSLSNSSSSATTGVFEHTFDWIFLPLVFEAIASCSHSPDTTPPNRYIKNSRGENIGNDFYSMDGSGTGSIAVSSAVSLLIARSKYATSSDGVMLTISPVLQSNGWCKLKLKTSQIYSPYVTMNSNNISYVEIALH